MHLSLLASLPYVNWPCLWLRLYSDNHLSWIRFYADLITDVDCYEIISTELKTEHENTRVKSDVNDHTVNCIYQKAMDSVTEQQETFLFFLQTSL